MASLARAAARNPEFVTEAVRLIGPERSVEAIDRALRSFFVYRDENEEVIRTPERMLRDRERLGRIEGDCDCISTLVAALACVLGYPVRFAAIRYDQHVSHFQHVFAEVLRGGQWLAVDLTVARDSPILALEVMEQYV